MNTQGEKKKETINLWLYSPMDVTSALDIELREKVTDLDEYCRISRASVFHSANAEMLLRFISDYDGGALRPDRCDAYPPIREYFSAEDLSRPVRWVSQAGASVLLKRKKTPMYQGEIKNERRALYWQGERRGPFELIRVNPDPYFLLKSWFYFQVSILKTRGVGFLKAFFAAYCEICQADYAFIASAGERHKKHFVKEPHSEGGTIEFMAGIDPEKGLPGVYWLNLFGKLYVDWFGREKFETLPCHRKEPLPDGGYLVQLDELPDYYLQPDADERVSAVIDHLGRSAFFDIKNRNRECITPDFGVGVGGQHQEPDDGGVV